MNEEIKEILDKLNFYKNRQKEPIYCEELITTGELQRLLDYITNLQQYYYDIVNKYEDLIEKYEKLQQELKEANDSITWWNNRFNAVERDNRNYKSKIERAIKRISIVRMDRDTSLDTNNALDYVLQALLKGDSDE